MASIIDVANQLIPPGVVSSSTDFAPIEVHPRSLPTCAWILAVTVPPAAAATFRLQVASTSGGSFSTISTYVWPAGTTGSKVLQLGAGGNMAAIVNNTSAWLRVSVTLSGAVTMNGSWLSKSSDGGPGLGSRSYSLDSINAF